jgi:4-nitrophenyl phosphatase
MDKTARPDVLLCDLDGVVWLAHRAVPGSVESLRKAAAAGIEVLYVTNNSFSTVAEQEEHLSAIGLDARGRVVTSAMSAGSILRPGGRVLVCGGAGLREEVARAGCEVVVAHEHPGRRDDYSDVVVGLYREFDYTVLADAMRAVRGGARLVGSNSDNSYPTPDGLLPGGGSVVAAIATAAGVEPVVTGKPHEPMARLVLSRFPGIGPDRYLMVGDKVSTDGAFARTIGCRFGFVLTGVGSAGDAPPDCITGADLAAVVDRVLA